MSLYIAEGTGKKTFRIIWNPGDPGTPNQADSKEELIAWSPKREPQPCANQGCGNRTHIYAYASRGRWQWAKQNYCRRCFDLRRHHGLELPELVALWEAQDRRCFQPECGRILTDPRLASEGSGPTSRGPDGTWRLRIDHDHKICAKTSHSCDKCRRGLVCNRCNCHTLAIRVTDALIVPESDDDLHRLLERLSPGERDRLRMALSRFPGQCARKGARHLQVVPDIALFDLDGRAS